MLKTVKVYKYKNSGKLIAGPVYDNHFIPINSDMSFSSQKPHRVNRSTELDATPYRIEILTTHTKGTVEFKPIRRWDERHLPEKTQDPNAPLEERIDITPAQQFNQAEKIYAKASDGHWSCGALFVIAFMLIWFSDSIGWWPAGTALALSIFVFFKTRTEGDPYRISEIQDAKERVRQKAENLLQEAIQDINVWKALDGIGFENAVAKIFQKKGYKVHHTPRSNDKGVDLIIVKDDNKTLVQCKAYTKNIGVAAVRELQGARSQFPDARHAMLVCLFDFSKAAKEFAQEHEIELFSVAKDFLQTEYRQ